jgi:hypothetical protein
MSGRKKVQWANHVGKPLTNVRFIEKEGKSIPLTKHDRRFVAANLKAIDRKHEAALQRAKDRVRLAEKKIDGYKKNAQTMSRFEKTTANKLRKTIRPAEIVNLKSKLMKVDQAKNKLHKQMVTTKLNLNEAENRLNAQRKAVIKEKAKKSGFFSRKK